MEVSWVINTNMGAKSDIITYVQGVKDSGARVIEVEHIPFSEEALQIEVEGPLVVYGAVQFIQVALRSPILAPGIFGTPDTFTYEAWVQHYADMLLNSQDATELTTVGEFCSTARDPESMVFTRPQHDTKSLVGAVWSVANFQKWCEEATKGDYIGVNQHTPIVVGEPYGIEAEWRIFVVDNQIASASQYHKNGRLFKSAGAPPDILAFAQKAIERWNPAPAYTLDLCRSGGNCFIVEAQGFNSAGHYACDMKKVATAVNQVAKRVWEEKNNLVAKENLSHKRKF